MDNLFSQSLETFNELSERQLFINNRDYTVATAVRRLYDELFESQPDSLVIEDDAVTEVNNAIITEQLHQPYISKAANLAVSNSAYEASTAPEITGLIAEVPTETTVVSQDQVSAAPAPTLTAQELHLAEAYRLIDEARALAVSAEDMAQSLPNDLNLATLKGDNHALAA